MQARKPHNKASVEEAKPELEDTLLDCKIELVKPFELSIIIKINILFFYYNHMNKYYLNVSKYKNWFISDNISSRIFNKSVFDITFNALFVSKLTR